MVPHTVHVAVSSSLSESLTDGSSVVEISVGLEGPEVRGVRPQVVVEPALLGLLVHPKGKEVRNVSVVPVVVI